MTRSEIGGSSSSSVRAPAESSIAVFSSMLTWSMLDDALAAPAHRL